MTATNHSGSGAAPVVATPWWEQFDLDAARAYRPQPTPSRRADPRLEAVAVAFERVATLPLAAFLLAGSPRSLKLGMCDPDRLASDWGFYARPALLADDDAYFTAPPTPDTVVETQTEQAIGVPAGALVTDLTFESGFEPVNPALREEYHRDVANRSVHARWWRRPGSLRPTLVSVHGFQAGQHALNTVLFDIPWLFAQGLDVVQFVLPHHGARAATVDGWHFLGLDIGRTAEAIAHSVWDLRTVVGYLISQGAPSVGVSGVSLGGYVAALLAGVDDRLGFAVPVSPAVSMADLFFDLDVLRPLLSPMLGRLDWDLGDLRRHMAVHTPLQHAPKLPPERLMIVGAVRDRITRPYQQRLLWEHWREPETFWHAGAHQLHLNRREYRSALKGFFARTGAI